MAHFFVFGGVGELGKAISIKRNGLNNNKTHHFTKHDGPLPSLLFVHSPAIPSVVVFPRTCRPTRNVVWWLVTAEAGVVVGSDVWTWRFQS